MLDISDSCQIAAYLVVVSPNFAAPVRDSVILLLSASGEAPDFFP